LSYDERTETTSYQPVMDIIQGEKQYQIVKITLNSGESIETTPEHPFYIKGKGWNPANSLKVGQALQLHNGTTVVVKEIDTSVQLGKVYNLTVANTHNYYVGRDGVLVHNCKWVKITKEMNSTAIPIAEGKNIDKIEVLKEKFGGKTKDWKKMKGWDANGKEVHWYTGPNGRKVGGKPVGSPDPF